MAAPSSSPAAPMPLVYLDDVARRSGSPPTRRSRSACRRRSPACCRTRRRTVASASGAGRPGDDLWLDAYVTDFLIRAAEKGYDVPAWRAARARQPVQPDRLRQRLRHRRRGHRLCALRARPLGPRFDRRPSLLCRLEARRRSARRSPRRRSARPCRSMATGRARPGLRGGALRPRPSPSVTRLGARLRHGAPRPGGGADARRRDARSRASTSGRSPPASPRWRAAATPARRRTPGCCLPPRR